MVKKVYLLWFLLLGLLPVPSSLGAQAETRCVVCDKRIEFGTYYHYLHPVLKKEVYICADCNALKLHCAKCGLPVLENAVRTGDGRYFCPIDAPLIALDENEIRQMFNAASAELIRLSSGKLTLKNPTITVNVFDVDYWNNKLGERGQPTATMQRHGLSTSRPIGGGGMVHTVLLYRGLSKAEMVAVCAHEYTHLWINENKPEKRTIEPQTIEALCEVVALALMESQQKPEQVQNIMANTYTEGRIKNAAAFYKVHGLNRVLEWVSDGQRPVFDELDFQVSFAAPSAPTVWQPPVAAYRAEFDRLQLKSIIANKDKTVALINDKTFVQGEERRMEFGGKKLLVKLLAVEGEAVTLQVEGTKDPVKLVRE